VPTARAERLELLVLLGSVTPPGRLRSALVAAIERARADGEVHAELIDLADLRVSFADGRDAGELGDDTAAVLDAVAAADAVLFATPVYRGSMTGALKNVFDLLPVSALEGKAVAVVAMGGSDHHFLGAERHIRDVLAFFGAVAAPVSVYLTGADFHDGEVGERAREALDRLIVATASLARALRADVELGPSPLGARFVRS
jgi:FMN reductase